MSDDWMIHRIVCYCQCTKEGYTFCTPMTVHGQSEPRAPPHQARQGRRARVRPKLDGTEAQGNKTTKSKGTKRLPPARSLSGASFSSPGKILAGAGSGSPGKTLAAAARPTPTERITLESTTPMGQGFGRYPRSGMQIFVKTFKIRCKLRRRQPLAGF